MTCDICREREATLFLQQSINGNDRRIQICGQCASDIQNGTIQAESLEQHEQIEEARELMQSVNPMNMNMGMGMDDTFLQPFRDLMRRFNRPAIDRRERSLWDNVEWGWPFGRQAMRPLERISIPDPETRKREERASRLVFNEDGTVSLLGEDNAQGVERAHEANGDREDHGERGEHGEHGEYGEHGDHDDRTEAQTMDPPNAKATTEHTEHLKPKDLTDVELIQMNFGEVMHYTDDVSAEDRIAVLKRRRDLAVQEEDYELAAEIRDALKSLQ